ncbi:MAG TPA: DUF4382 domain-containing protein [Bacteroidota bacterium]|nr:DUF4382 domain-containing protein [Bacteroidota bacterium]
MRAVLNIISLFTILVLVGCASDNATNPSEGEGEIRMHMVDSPTAAEEVVVVVNRVEVHSAGSDSTSGWVVVNDQPASYDLLKLRNGASAILGSAKLKAGRYTQIRLILGAGSYVRVGGTNYDLQVASGFQTGVKLVHTFEIEADKVYELYLDFDADRSVRQSGPNQYRLTPVIRVQASVTSGSISGSIVPANAGAYIWTTVGRDTVSTYAAADGTFKLMALPEGTYTVTIESLSNAYLGMAVPNVVVARQQTTTLGTITLSSR